MAGSATLFTNAPASGHENDDVSSIATPSKTVSAGAVYVVDASSRRTGATSPSAPTISGWGITWPTSGNTGYTSQLCSDGDGRITRWVGIAPSGATGVLTITFPDGTQNNAQVIVTEYTGLVNVDLASLVIQQVSATQSGGSSARSHAFPSGFAVSTNTTHAAIYWQAGTAQSITPDANMSEIDERKITGAEVGILEAQWRSVEEATVDWTLSNTTLDSATIISELKTLVTHSAAAAFTGAATINPVATVTHNATADLATAATVSPAAKVTYAAAAVLATAVTISPAAVATYAAAAALSTSAVVAVDGLVTRIVAAALATSATISAVAITTHNAAAVLDTAVTIVAVAVVTYSAAAAISGTATISPAGIVTYSAAAALATAAAINPSGFLTLAGVAVLATAVTISPDGTVTVGTPVAGAASLTGSATIAAAAVLTYSAATVLAAAVALAGVAFLTLGATTSLAGAATTTGDETVYRGAESALAAAVTLSAAGFMTRNAETVLAAVVTVSPDAETFGIQLGAISLLAAATLAIAAGDVRVMLGILSITGTGTYTPNVEGRGEYARDVDGNGTFTPSIHGWRGL